MHQQLEVVFPGVSIVLHRLSCIGLPGSMCKEEEEMAIQDDVRSMIQLEKLHVCMCN